MSNPVPDPGNEVEKSKLEYDKDLASTYIELAKLSQESFLNRRSYEWKVAFGLWVAIGFITYFALDKAELLQDGTVIALGVLYGVLALIWFFWWQVPIRRAFEQDKSFKHYYMHRAEGWQTKWPKQVGYWDVTKGKHIPWTYGQTAITVAFMAASFIVILMASQKGDSGTASKVEFKASGESVKVQAEAVKK